MPTSMKDLGIDRLGLEERLALVHEIWDSIADEPSSTPLTAAQRAELDKRVQMADADPNDAQDWETILNDALARARK